MDLPHLQGRRQPYLRPVPLFLIANVLFFALVPTLVFIRRQRPLVAHAVFSLHLYAFMLLLFCVATAIPAFSALMGGPGFESSSMDYFLANSLLVVCAAYLFFAIREVYEVRGVVRVLSTLVLTIAVGAIVLGYRFFLLIVTLYTT